jgi:replication-associated recombination protein RarA
MRLMTKRGYSLPEVASALQKAIRRQDARLAGYFAIEMFESGYHGYVWRRLLTISAEDCWGVITNEIESLHRSWQVIHAQKPGGGRIFVAKAAILLSEALKSRDADHLTNLVYDRKAGVTDEAVEELLAEARAGKLEIPDYALDCHTPAGKKRGKTKADFFVDEQAALKPRQPGLFDADVTRENLDRPAADRSNT